MTLNSFETSMTIVDTLKHEVGMMFDMINQAVSRMDGEFWKEDENDWTYSYLLFHILEAIEFYNSNSAKEWKPINDVSVNSREKETEALKSKDKLFFEDYTARVKKQTMNILSNHDDKGILGNDGFGERGFNSIMHKYMYVMNHSMFHLGELTKSLRARNMKRIVWK